MANYPTKPDAPRDPSGQKQTHTPQEKNDTNQGVDRSSVKVDPGKDPPKEQAKPSAHVDGMPARHKPFHDPNPQTHQGGLQADIDHYKRLDEEGKAELKRQSKIPRENNT